MSRLLLSGLVTVMTLTWGDPSVVSAAAAQAELPTAGSIDELVTRLERVISNGDPHAYHALLDPSADPARAKRFGSLEIRPGATRVVIRERDRRPIKKAAPESNYRLLLDVLAEYGDRARVATWEIDVRMAADGWRVANQQQVSAVDGLYRLSLDTSHRFQVHNFTVRAEDLELTLVEGSVYHVNADDQLTGLLLVGRGEMRFSPSSVTEQRQIQIAAGEEMLTTRFESAYIRAGNVYQHADRPRLVEEAPVDERESRAAREVFLTESAKTFVVDLGDLSEETWSLLPPAGDFVAEVDTQRFDSLTYLRARSEPEDIALFDRRRQRTMSTYRSQERLATEGRFFSEETLAAYEVIDYDVDIAYSPDRLWIDGRTRMRVRARENFTGQMNVRLADSLVIHAVQSDAFGRLLSLRVLGQNLVLVTMPSLLVPGTEFTLTLTYSGRLEPQDPDREALWLEPLAPSAQPQKDWQREFPFPSRSADEPWFLYSTRSYWYPQSPVGGYATARIRISVPTALTVIATGVPAPDSPRLLDTPPGAQPRQEQYEFAADRPVRYLSFVVSRFTIVNRVTLALKTPGGENATAAAGAPTSRFTAVTNGGMHKSVALTVMANPLQARWGHELLEPTTDIVDYYHSLIGDAPYGSFTLALVESAQPGGHSPAHFAMLNQPPPNAPAVWRSDPVNFTGFPEFYLAHEIAHQWWGQGIGGQNYHEQWLSEGISQYFAVLYAEHIRGRDVFGDLLKQMRDWAIRESDQGPVYLGYRLGHVRKESRIFRALVYNKGGVVLHMLRRFIGDPAFFRGLQRFYAEGRYRRLGTEDLRHAMEIESGRPLERFFDQWIHGATIPQITYAYQVHDASDHQVSVRIEQTGADIVDVPVTLTLQFDDRRTRDVVIPVSDATVEVRLPLEAPLRSLRMSERDGTLAEARRVNY